MNNNHLTILMMPIGHLAPKKHAIIDNQKNLAPKNIKEQNFQHNYPYKTGNRAID